MTADNSTVSRVLSGIQPTADSYHLGNYLGALKPVSYTHLTLPTNREV